MDGFMHLNRADMLLFRDSLFLLYDYCFNFDSLPSDEAPVLFLYARRISADLKVDPPLLVVAGHLVTEL